MDLSKEIQFSFEFVKRVYERGIIQFFNNNLNKCQEEITRKIREESVIIDNPNPKYQNQKWCLINIEGLGITKIPIAETPRYIKAITIAHPVTDLRCINSFKTHYEKDKK